jgi:GT2 family glycosyltransferase
MNEKTDTLPVAIFCSINRPEMLHESILCAVRQSVPCHIIVSVPEDKDVAAETRDLDSVTVVTGRRGLTAQRNHALRSIQGSPEAIIFLDDDVELDQYYVEQILRTYREHPEVAMVNGANLAHGIYPAGTLDREMAKKLIVDCRNSPLAAEDTIPMTTAYGCRMSIRGSLLGKVFFDERLVLYGYLEDLDLAFACRKYGSIVENPRALGVHIEVAFGRMGEKRRGYSEVVNPFYIWSKRTGAQLPRVVVGSLARSARNAIKAIKGEGHERLVGNLLGWANVATFRPSPEKILEM